MEEDPKKKAKLMGRDGNSFTEQKMKQTVKTIIQITRIYKNKGIHRVTVSLTTRCPVLSQQ